MSAVAAATVQLAACRGVSVIHRSDGRGPRRWRRSTSRSPKARRSPFRALRIGQDDAPAPARRPARAERRRGALAERAALLPRRRRPRPRPRRRDRLRLSGLQPAAHFTRLRERRLHGLGRRAGRPAGPAGIRPSCCSWSAWRQKREALPSELSGGEAQRVAIARALAQPSSSSSATSPPDTSTPIPAARVLDLLEALRERFGFALVIATHDRGVASRSRARSACATGGMVREGAS